MTRTVRKIAAACAMAFAAGAAHAATDPIDWNYSFELKWVDAGFTSSASPLDSHYRDSSVVSWGYYGGDDRAIINDPDRARSSIIINPVYRGNETSLVTNGNIVDANAFIHYNNAINSNYETLDSATLQLTITLTAKDGSGVTQTWQQPFEVHFIETPNLSGNNVADGDIFTITWDGSYSQTFTYDGFEYSFDYFENYYPHALNPLLASQCNAAGAAANCVGFLTPENARTRVNFGFNIAAQAVPEPETYAMLLAGLGIVGMVARRRRGYIHD